MKTDLRLFMKNYKTMCKYGSNYISSFYYNNFKEKVKICKCVIPFTHDDLLIEKDNIYLLREKKVGCVLYELTGLWESRGHHGYILTVEAVNNGIRGWNIPYHYRDYFKIIGLNHLCPFIYWEE